MTYHSPVEADRASIRKKKALRRHAAVTIVVLTALLALRLKPFDFAKLLSHGSTIQQSAVQDKKQCLQRLGSEFAIQTITFRAQPIVADVGLPIPSFTSESRQLKGFHYNRPPPLA